MANLKNIVGAAILVVALVAAVLAYSALKTPAQASAPIEAVPLAQSGTAASGSPTSTAATVDPTQPTAADATAADPTATGAAAAAAASAPEATTPEATAASENDSGVILARIVPEESEVRFLIDEVLNGSPKTVVGTTNQVAGEIAVNPNDPSQTRVGVIQVNARTLTTDSGMRNRTIANRILQTGQYEYITFTPTSIEGLPEQGSVGQDYTFKIVGDLTIRDVTKQVTFDVTATPQSESRLEGTATTTILYSDYNITIPSVPQVASVADEVKIEIDFVAVAQ